MFFCFFQPFRLFQTTEVIQPGNMEIGQVVVRARWRRFTFTRPLKRVPVVVVAPRTSGREAVTIRVKDVRTTGFSAIIAKPTGSKVRSGGGEDGEKARKA